jgi:hypothetical protein
VSAPELRDGDTILVRATIKTFIRQKDGVHERVPMAHIGAHPWTLDELPNGYAIEDRKIVPGDRVKAQGHRDTFTVVAQSPERVVPPLFWCVNGSDPTAMYTFARPQLERMPVT